MPDSPIEIAAQLMTLAARTAPKSAGKDYVVIKTILGEALRRLAEEMTDYGLATGKHNFDRDARGVAQSEAVLLVGIHQGTSLGLNCGACGVPTCAERKPNEGPEFMGNQCAMRILDLGIALGSAVKMASMLNVDNRIMYRIGVAARRMKLIEADLVMGIPLAATGKNIFFDRV